MGVQKEMIIVEDILQEMFTYLPLSTSTDGSQDFAHKFLAGNEHELNAFLKNSDTSEVYPLIWLTYPYSEEHEKTKVTINNINLVLAVATNSSMMNDQRLLDTYKPILIPLFENIRMIFRRCGIFSLTDDKIKVIKFPNYSSETNRAGITIDRWDALKLTFGCTIINGCVKPIKI